MDNDIEFLFASLEAALENVFAREARAIPASAIPEPIEVTSLDDLPRDILPAMIID